MIKDRGEESVVKGSNIVLFPKLPKEKPTLRPVSEAIPGVRSLHPIDLGLDLVSQNSDGDVGEVVSFDRTADAKSERMSVRTYRQMPTSEKSRATLKARFVAHISSAIHEGNVTRLDALFQKPAFQQLSPADKLQMARSILNNIKDLRLCNMYTKGLSRCYEEAFQHGYGTREDFKDWLNHVANQLSVVTLERLVLAPIVNHDIRVEAAALVYECYN
jgi:hypothetical protein